MNQSKSSQEKLLGIILGGLDADEKWYMSKECTTKKGPRNERRFIHVQHTMRATILGEDILCSEFAKRAREAARMLHVCKI